MGVCVKRYSGSDATREWIKGLIFPSLDDLNAGRICQVILIHRSKGTFLNGCLGVGVDVYSS
jgi:hypothetical protein